MEISLDEFTAIQSALLNVKLVLIKQREIDPDNHMFNAYQCISIASNCMTSYSTTSI